MKKTMFLCCCLMFSLATQAQINQTGFKNTQTLISNWPGWLNKPDTVRVFVDSTFTAAEKDSARVAAKRGSVQLTVSFYNFSFSRPSKKYQGFEKEKFYFVNRSSNIIDNCD